MNKTRVPVVIMAVALFSTAILALQTYLRATEAMGSSPTSAGMGELHLLEAQQDNASGGVVVNSSLYVGLGDLRRIEGLVSSRPGIGFGDLRRIEALASSRPGIGFGDLRRIEALASSRPDIGFGDLRRIEAEQALAAINVSGIQIPGRICPNPSTSYGERDSGASAPLYVLSAKSC